MSITVIDHGETIFQDNLGYRNIAKKKPVTSDTIFHIASMTKSFTGACIYRLQAQGKLSLDDLITKHLPSARSLDPVVASTATIADLLGHCTGLQKADNMWLGSDGELLFTRDQTAAIFSHLRPQVTCRTICPWHTVLWKLASRTMFLSRAAVQAERWALREGC